MHKQQFRGCLFSQDVLKWYGPYMRKVVAWIPEDACEEQTKHVG